MFLDLLPIKFFFVLFKHTYCRIKLRRPSNKTKLKKKNLWSEKYTKDYSMISKHNYKKAVTRNTDYH